LGIDEVLRAASILEKLPHTGIPQQFLCTDHRMGWPRFYLVFLIPILPVEIGLGGCEELGTLQVAKIGANLGGGK
jgi:hypothetical protein